MYVLGTDGRLWSRGERPVLTPVGSPKGPSPQPEQALCFRLRRWLETAGSKPGVAETTDLPNSPW